MLTIAKSTILDEVGGTVFPCFGSITRCRLTSYYLINFLVGVTDATRYTQQTHFSCHMLVALFSLRLSEHMPRIVLPPRRELDWLNNLINLRSVYAVCIDYTITRISIINYASSVEGVSNQISCQHFITVTSRQPCLCRQTGLHITH